MVVAFIAYFDLWPVFVSLLRRRSGFSKSARVAMSWSSPKDLIQCQCTATLFYAKFLSSPPTIKYSAI